MRYIRLCILVLATSVLAQTPASVADTVTDRALKQFNVPGIAVAIVKDGQVVHSRGYGVRKLGDSAPVTPQTLFGIASNSKAFTSALLAMLVDQGKIQWDDPVIKHLPTFQMYDPYVTREMTVRDLLVHRSGLGLGAGDLMFFPASDLSRDEFVYRLRFIKPATSFRSAYAYDNILYVVAGQLIAAVNGKSWDDCIKEQIFTPLGMKHSNTSVRQFDPKDDYASPHSVVEGKLQPIRPDIVDNAAAAGAINSSVAEMALWVQTQLNGGVMPNGKRLFTERQQREMWRAHTPQPIGDPPPLLAATKPNFSEYALGWVLTDYRGHKLVWHTGGLSGMVSRVTLVPDMKLGIIVLTNQESGGAFSAITLSLLDQYFGIPATDWVTAYDTAQKQRQGNAMAEIKKLGDKRNTTSRPSLPLSGYAGRYRDAWYGDVTIQEEKGKLVMRFTHSPDLTGELEHWQYDTFVARWKNRAMDADAFVTFALNPDGSVDQIKMKAVSPLTDFSYDFHDLLLKPAPAGPAR